jgi:hypothetical protein
MIKLCEPEIPKIYYVNCFTYQCESCGNIFEIMFPNSDDILKLEEINGKDIRWLPVYGVGGYLDLLTKLVVGHSFNDAITMEKSRRFMKEFQKYSEKGSSGNGFDISYRKSECKNCKSNEINILNEKILENPELTWLKISCDLIKL